MLTSVVARTIALIILQVEDRQLRALKYIVELKYGTIETW
jgi:hypothetical protein